MSISQASVTPINMDITPCRVKWNGTDLGGTEGGVKITGHLKMAPIKADQYGDTILDQKVSGIDCKIETILAELKSKDIWKIAYPFAKRISAGNGAIYMDNPIGSAALAASQQLLLHPLSIADATLDYDHIFYKTLTMSASEIEFGATKQQGLKVVWQVFLDTGVSPARFWFHGDPANGAVAATAGTPSFTGTGNGTITSVSVGSVTVTETITVKCVGVPGANASNWVVSGSVSGIIGYFQVTGAGGHTNFTSNLINLTVTDNSTDFVLNDNWAIAMVAANYA